MVHSFQIHGVYLVKSRVKTFFLIRQSSQCSVGSFAAGVLNTTDDDIVLKVAIHKLMGPMELLNRGSCPGPDEANVRVEAALADGGRADRGRSTKA
jgi:hypothetical protein